MATLICDCINKWLHGRPISTPGWHRDPERIKRQLHRACLTQQKIGWDQFLRGRISKDWTHAIHTYYVDRQPGDSYNPEQWMRTTIAAIWKFSLTMWRQRNLDKHGVDSAITLEKQRKEAVTRATAAYNDTLGAVSRSDSYALHHAKVGDILNWTKQHLDAYLKTAEVICEQNVEPG